MDKELWRKLNEVIRKCRPEDKRSADDVWCVYSEKGRLMGRYKTKKEAEKRLRQIEYFKHKAKEESLEDLLKRIEMELEEEWETLPIGWTEGSLRQFWDTLTGGKKPGEGGVRACIAKIRRTYPAITDPASFCASLADRLFGKEWRSKRAERRRARE